MAKKKTVKSSRRGAVASKKDQGLNVVEGAKIDVMSITTLHIITGKGKETIRQRIGIVKPEHVGNGRNGAKYYDPKKVLPLIYERDFIDAVSPGSDQPEGKKHDPKFRKEMALAEKAEIELAEQKKEMVRVDDIIEQIAEEYALLRQRLLSIPTRIAKKILLAKNESEALEMLSSEINGAIMELNADAEENLKAIDVKTLKKEK